MSVIPYDIHGNYREYVTSSMKTTASVTLTVYRVRLYSMPYTFGSSVAHNEDT